MRRAGAHLKRPVALLAAVRTALLAVAGAVTLVVGGLATTATAHAAGTSYVAIGDSYTAAPGIEPYSPTSPAACGQSELNYPHLVAKALDLALTDVSCGGATTADETESQFEGQPPQDDALSASTEVVTVSMGGNDHDLFATLANGCTQLDAIEYVAEKAPCRTAYDGFVRQTFAEDGPEEEAALAHVKALAPNAKVFVVGYPDIAPKDGECLAKQIPWYSRDLTWFRNRVQKVADKLTKASAKLDGATFVDTFKPSEGHDACQAAGVRWIEPIVGSLTGVQLHPNATGEEQDAYDVELAMLKAGVR